MGLTHVVSFSILEGDSNKESEDYPDSAEEEDEVPNGKWPIRLNQLQLITSFHVPITTTR